MSLPWIDCRIILDDMLAAGTCTKHVWTWSQHNHSATWPRSAAERTQRVSQALDDLNMFADQPQAWRQATVYVGSPYIVFVPIPWQETLTSPRQRLAFAQACWSDSSGAHGQAGEFLWRLAPERYGSPSVAIGLCAATWAAIQAWRRASRVRYLRWRSATEAVVIDRAWRHASVWCVSSHASHIMLAQVQAQAWQRAFTLARNDLTDAALLNAAHRLTGAWPEAIGVVDAQRLAHAGRLDSHVVWRDARTVMDQT